MTLIELRDALAKATGPDRELDCWLYVLLHGWELADVPADYDGQNAGKTYVPPGGISKDFVYPPKGKIGLFYHVGGYGTSRSYTASIDAAVTLVGKPYAVRCWGDHASAVLPFAGRDVVQGKAATAALALCLARVELEIGKGQR